MVGLLYTAVVLLLLVCVFLVLLILIQKGRGGGLASAFGGAGGNTAFGSKTGDVLTWATSIVFGIFLILSVTVVLVANKVHDTRTKGIAGAPTPAAIPSGDNPLNADGAATPSEPLNIPAPTTAPSTAPASN